MHQEEDNFGNNRFFGGEDTSKINALVNSYYKQLLCGKCSQLDILMLKNKYDHQLNDETLNNFLTNSKMNGKQETNNLCILKIESQMDIRF